METRISSKGQITIPVAVREKLKIKTGDLLKIKIAEEGVIIISTSTGKKAKPSAAPEVLKETAGAWKDMKETGEEYVRKLRKEDNVRWRLLDIE